MENLKKKMCGQKDKMPIKLVNFYRVKQAIEYLSDNFKEQPDLSLIANKINMSPYHFQRIFKDWVGLSPKKFLSYLTVDFLRHKIRETDNMIHAAEISGLSSQSRVHDLFVHIEGVTPHQYKTRGLGMEIVYGFHGTPFGLCFIAVTEHKIVSLKFIDMDMADATLHLFEQEWNRADIVQKQEYTQKLVTQIFTAGNRNDRLELLVKGTSFQIKVWEALINIPFGQVASFQQVAEIIGQPKAVRAVGSAVGVNPVSYLIPCHRVIAGNGTMGNYHFGKARKQLMIGREAVFHDSDITSGKQLTMGT
ncbi:methylated-DNA--[protein]-cysteine S-methyltransferase [Flagellimonas olearia]|uniref:methylated-DNA--[protein]-cysteine S-methyltransferase n=1 Tax=Flagellimonas olearia TaxID=552546 RepID=A0A6I1E315_9FLAO|nr:methylated-DNA--[protein]-cysteine S-methyltransferase [Allomuricauda olearia]KAB7530245.1 methylated-DNA--[protein]-cysteine S-methyltransferase [Allomuricauda olearia]